jgi:hypothetical protein
VEKLHRHAIEKVMIMAMMMMCEQSKAPMTRVGAGTRETATLNFAQKSEEPSCPSIRVAAKHSQAMTPPDAIMHQPFNHTKYHTKVAQYVRAATSDVLISFLRLRLRFRST